MHAMRLGVALGAAAAVGAGLFVARRWRGKATETKELATELALCRICHTESPLSELISPCKCKGTQVSHISS